MRKVMWKRIPAMLMTLAIAVSLLPAVTLPAKAVTTGNTDISSAVSVPAGSTEVMTRFDDTLFYKFVPAATAFYTITTSDAPDGISGVCYQGTLHNTPDAASALAQGGNLMEHVSITYKLTAEVTYYIGLLNDSISLTPCMLNIIAANSAPTVDALTAISCEDTAENDAFSTAIGAITAGDSDGTISSFGISDGTTGGSTLIGGVTYDVSKTGTYGTLYVKSSTGEYAYDPDDAAINAVSANQSEAFTVTATDNGGLSDSETLTVNLTGVNDAPALTATWGTPTYTENGAAAALFSEAAVNTVESGQTILTLKLTVSNLSDGASELLNLDGTDVALTDGNSATTAINSMLCGVSKTGSTATVTLSKAGGIPTENMQALVNTITYRNSSETPTTDNNRVITLTWIQDNGGTVNGGADAATLAIASTVSIVAVNDAPVLDSTGTMTLTSTTEDSTGDAGDTVAAIIASAAGDKITDINAGALEGIAVTALTGAGTWQYNAGGGWLDMGDVSQTSALLLSDAAFIRFVPTASFNNAQTANITFRAWDRTSGAQGTKADASTNGGITAFSTATETASIEVTAINDDPAITGRPASVTVTENTASSLDLSPATFSDADSGTNNITLTLSVNSGTLSASDAGGVTVSGSESNTLTLTGTAAGIEAYLNTASSIQYTGAAGTFGPSAAALTLTANDAGNTGIDGGGNVSLGSVSINIAAVAPTVTNVTSGKANVTYGLGETIDITVEFSHIVIVEGTPQLKLETGAADTNANYTGGSGSNTLTFAYTTQAGDETGDLNYTGTSALALNGATIKRGETNADLTLPAIAGAGSLGTNKDIAIAAYPAVTLSVSSANIAEGGGTSAIAATLSEISSQNVVVTIAYSGTAVSATDYIGTASTTITIPAGSLSASAATGITAIQDTVTEGNETAIIDISDVSKGVENGGQQATITILDDDIPTVTSVSSATADGSYKVGSTVAVTVTFSANVTVDTTNGTPQLLLETGLADRTIDYVSGSGTTALTFNYTVEAGDTSPDLDYAGPGSLTLGGGAITSSGIPASLVLPAPGAAGSLGANSAIVIDTTAPDAPAIITASQSINADSFTIIGTAQAGAAITVTGTAATATADPSGNFSITVSLTQDAVNTLVLKAADAAGNESAPASVAITEDSTSPNMPVIITLSQTVNADSITIIGTAQAGATITVTGAAATATADAGGNFSITVNLTQNAVNTFVLKAADAAGNESAPASVAITEDSMAPAIPASTIGVSNLTYNSVRLTWTGATDAGTLPENLQYKVVYSTSDNISVVSDAETNGTAFGGWTANSASADVTGLTASTEYHFNVLVKDEAGNKTVYTAACANTTAAPRHDNTPSTPTPPSGSAVVEVNGEKQDAGQSSTQTTGGQTVTTITVDDTKLNSILEQKGNNPTVTLPASGSPHVVVGELTGQTVKNLETKEAVLEIKTETVTYTLPASQINIDAVSSQLGTQIELKDIKVSVKIAEPPADTVQVIEDTASRGNYQIVVKPVEFEITCMSGNRALNVSRFNGYVERTVAIPDTVDPGKITTGIVLNADGTFSHVPTSIVVINGKYFAKINSLTNSTYSVIYNPVTFTDVSSHWAKDAVNDMGSRMVVAGIGNGIYEPERDITRAEFAAIVVRAMGLRKGTAESAFGDVTRTDWFNGYVDTATSYSLITGFDSVRFAPNDTITREQAMTILARAMKLTGLNVSLTDSEVSALLANYTDAGSISDYAKAGAAACIQAGVVSGTTATTISPKEYVTRAEVAVMVQRLLQKSGLI